MAHPVGRHLTGHNAVAAFVQRKMAQHSVGIGPVGILPGVGGDHLGRPAHEHLARLAVQGIAQPVHRVFAVAPVIEQNVRPVQPDEIERRPAPHDLGGVGGKFQPHLAAQTVMGIVGRHGDSPFSNNVAAARPVIPGAFLPGRPFYHTLCTAFFQPRRPACGGP